MKPYVSLGYMDSLERIEEWIDKRFDLFDSYFGYVNDVGFGRRLITESRYTESWTDIKTIYDLNGNRLNDMDNGVNIVIGKNGQAKKVYVK